MSIAMLVLLMICLCGGISGGALVGFLLGRRQLPRSSAPLEDRRLAEQVELLNDELQRVKEQADFTEGLLTERGSTGSEETHPGGTTD